MTITIPVGPVTPHGCYEIRKGDLPMVSLVSANQQIIVWLMGGQSKPDPMTPESVQVKKLSGLIAPWKMIDQQGATQDGVSFVDALYDPTEINMVVDIWGRDPRHMRWVKRKLIEAIDAKLQAELGYMTHEMGYWWAPVRWWSTPPDPLQGPQKTHQQMTLRLRGDSGFWQSYPDTAEFSFAYEDMTDTFTADYSEDQNLGPNWPMLYSGNGVGYLYANGKHAKWSDDPDSIFFTGTRRVVAGPFKDYSTAGDQQTVSITINDTPEFAVGSGAAQDIWARMGRNPDGSWDGSGIRARIGWGYVEISYFVDFVGHRIDRELQLLAPHAGDVYTLICGTDGVDRRYRLMRNGAVSMTANESGTNSLMDADHRGVGFGLQGGAKAITQATPGKVRDVSANSVQLDTFAVDYSDSLGPNWPLYYEGRNDAYVRADGGKAEWVDNSGTETQEVVCGPYKDFDTETDNQVVSMVLGSFPEWSLPETGANDLWGRMGVNPDGTWDGNGVRLRVERRSVYLTAFVNFEAVWDRVLRPATDRNSKRLLWTPYPGDKWTLVCGYTGDKRLFKVHRNNAEILAFKESGTQSKVGPAYRGIGFGVRAGGALITQASPAIVRKISAGDNADVTQEGFLDRHNAGDQIAYDEITVYGPGTFGIANGPGSTDMVTLGPLKVGEIAHIRTDPRNRGVFDFTDRTGDETAPILFGANPTDTMYAKLTGRFTAAYAIPAKEAGMRVQTYQVKVSITGGNADSRIDASLTPLRRHPE